MFFSLMWCEVASANSFNAKVIAVMDGDTVLIIRIGRKPEKVRLLHIDAPEKTQPYGLQSKQSLADMVLKRQVNINVVARDQYGRLLGDISLNGHSVNEEQVKRGMAWEYSGYHNNKVYVALQHNAQQARRGLWQQRSPQAPWQYRKQHSPFKHKPQHKFEKYKKHPANALVYDATCGHKTHCSEMTSCDEAHFYLTRCEEKSLDANGDGVPCEALCGATN
ncbi:MAG: thermonuclease family protein [Gallionellaceae bacterium]|nr:thermonuclease family protein [Gallionellaceae bacterium]